MGLQGQRKERKEGVKRNKRERGQLTKKGEGGGKEVKKGEDRKGERGI